MIPYGRQRISEKDIQAVTAVLRSDFLTQGPAIPAFEEKTARRVGARYAVAVNSATSALHIACLALGLGPGDVLWTSPITFVASANCALYCGASVDFVDICPRTYNLRVEALAEKLRSARKTGKLPKIIVPVHMCGQPCDMAEIHALSKEFGFSILEDASHAIGATYKGEPTGNCRYSDITVFSFHPVKIITTGEGGMALTNSADLARRMARLRTHGITRDHAEMKSMPHGPWYYEQIELGYNYRITDIQAALGASQLDCLDEFVARRTDLARRYDELFRNLPLTAPRTEADRTSAWHLYIVRLHDGAKQSHRATFEQLRRDGIGVNLHYFPVYLQPYYQDLGFREGWCPEAERYYAQAISLPLYADLSGADQDRVVQAVRAAIV